MVKKKSIKIGKRFIGDGYKPFIIAEVAQSHGGNIKKVHKFIKMISKTGADAIKFQTHIADAESTLDEPFRVKISDKYNTRYDYWKSMEFNFTQWKKIYNYSKKYGLIFLSSPFSVEAVKLLKKVGVPAWKVGSGEFFADNLISSMIKTKLPILLSTGMSNNNEIDKRIKFLKKNLAKFGIFQCTSMYPSSLKLIGLNVVREFKKKYNCPVGLSDHTGSIFSGMAALANGANILEVHVNVDNNINNPDLSSSVNLIDLKRLCDARDAFFLIENHPVDKNRMSHRLKNMKRIFGKSLALKKDLKKNTILKAKLLTTKKPGFGIPENKINLIIGKKLRNDVPRNRLLRWKDFYAKT